MNKIDGNDNVIQYIPFDAIIPMNPEYFGHTAPPIPDQCDPLISEQSEPLFELCFSYYSGLSAAKGRSKVSHR